MSKRVITLDMYRRIQAVREARAAIPTDKQLCEELGICMGTLHNALGRQHKRWERVIAKEREAEIVGVVLRDAIDEART